MKKFVRTTAPFVFLLTFNTGCFIQQELPVEYDYSYRGRFNKYDTFDFIVRDPEFLNYNPSLNNVISGAIESHMNFLGYKRRGRKPDLLLSFSIFQDTLSLRGYDQPDIEEWVNRPDRDLEYNKLDIGINKGTLFIQFFDRKQNVSIWQGYATDKYNRVDLSDQREVRNAIKSILNKYQFFSQEFIKEQKEMQKNKRRNS